MSEEARQIRPGTDATANMNRGSRSTNTTTIDLVEVFGVIWHWIWLILLVALAMGTAAYGFSKFALPEEYQSTTKIYVLDKSGAGGSNSQTTYSDLQVGIQLTKDYVELIKSRTVLEAVLKDNKLDGVYTYEQFADMVDVETPTDTRIVTITVTNHDPALAQKLANDIRTRSSELIINTMQIDAVNTYEEANYPDRKSGPSCGRWAIVAALLGALIVSAIVIVRYLMDDTIKTSEDVEKYLGLSNLALIPYDEEVAAHGEDPAARRHHGLGKKHSSHGDAGSHAKASSYSGSGYRTSSRESAGTYGASTRSGRSSDTDYRNRTDHLNRADRSEHSFETAYHSHMENVAEKEFQNRTTRSDSGISRAGRPDPAASRTAGPDPVINRTARSDVASREADKADRKDRRAGASAEVTTPIEGDLTSEIDAELVDQMLESKRAEHAHAGRS